MSDLQIVTGFAILLSGYAQLQCDLLALNWLIILELAWFSCLTHLSCLTIIPGYLHFHSSQRSWRLLAMGVLVVLLFVGFLSTAYPSYRELTDMTVIETETHIIQTPYALCVFSCHLDTVHYEVQNVQLSFFWTPLLSACFILVAFISRVIKVHEYLSTKTSRVEALIGDGGRIVLRIIYNAFFTQCDALSLKRSFGYRPILAVFLTLRFFMDMWTSITFEVCIPRNNSRHSRLYTKIFWVCLALSWGIWQLFHKVTGFSSEYWKFGQIVSVIMLLAPVISIIGASGESEF